MKEILIVILTLVGFVTFAQENKLDRIESEVNSINSDSTLIKSAFDRVKLTGSYSDGGGILRVWQNEKQICKIVEEIGLSYGRIRIVIYLESGLPIKIVETEENFGYKNDHLDYNELKEVFKASIYVFDWEKDDGKIERIGKRVFSEGNCSTFEYEPIVQRAKKAILK